MISVVLIEDHDIVRQGIGILLSGEPDIEVVADTGEPGEGLELVAELRPRVVVSDLRMAEISGLEIARRVRECCPGTNVVILSMYTEAPHVAEALRAGALGYVVKEAGIAELSLAVRSAAQGQSYLSPTLDVEYVDAYLASTADFDTSEYKSLTPRERQILEMVALGNTSASIAGQLTISRRTVEVHRANIKRKLRLKSYADLVRYAVARGYISLDE
ncbi:MAG: response regulator transcription factor [Chloroflexota bacterium]|nr:response regulator transcription factor [Chloroflexota bacterium]